MPLNSEERHIPHATVGSHFTDGNMVYRQTEHGREYLLECYSFVIAQRVCMAMNGQLYGPVVSQKDKDAD